MSRRSFLVAGASAAFVAACGTNGKGSASGGSASAPPTTAAATDLVLATLSDTSALVPGSPQRVAFGFFNKEGVLLTSPVAPQVDVEVSMNGQLVGNVKSTAHATDLPRPYYPVEFTPSQAGVYDVATTVNGTPITTQVQIPATTSVVAPGQKMIPVDTATTSDPHGVQLVCTRSPACPLHDVTLRQALAGGTPVAFLVATPKFCQVAICGPVLDVLVKQRDQFPQIKMLHAEVYPSDAAAQPGPQQQVTEAVSAYGLTFEPALYLAKPDGTIAKRIDTIFDGVELHDALAQLVA